MKRGHHTNVFRNRFFVLGSSLSPSFCFPPHPASRLPSPSRSLTVLRVLFVIGIPLTIINISFACAYAWLFANQYAYTKDDWQRCLIYPNQVGRKEGRKGREGREGRQGRTVETDINSWNPFHFIPVPFSSCPGGGRLWKPRRGQNELLDGCR